MERGEFTKEMKIMILKKMQETGKTWAEISEDFRLPEMFIITDDNPDEIIEFENEKMPLKTFQNRFPFRRHVVVRGPKN